MAVIADGSFKLRENEFLKFLPPVTLTSTRWPSYTNCPGDTPDVRK